MYIISFNQIHSHTCAEHPPSIIFVFLTLENLRFCKILTFSYLKNILSNSKKILQNFK